MGLWINVIYSGFTDFSIANTGEFAFTGNIDGPGVVISSNSAALWAGSLGIISLVVRTGDLEPGATNGVQSADMQERHSLQGPVLDAAFGFIGPPNIDDSHAISFSANSSSFTMNTQL